MESKRAATGPHPLHLRHWRQCYRFCRQKGYECAADTAGLVVGSGLYPACYHYMANGGTDRKHSIRTISLLY